MKAVTTVWVWGRHQRPHNTIRKSLFKSARLCGLIVHLHGGNIQKKQIKSFIRTCWLRYTNVLCRKTTDAENCEIHKPTNQQDKKGFNSCRTKKLKGTSETSFKNKYLQCFPSLAVHQQVVFCSYIMYKCSTIKKQKNHFNTEPRWSERSTVWAHFNTEANSTRATSTQTLGDSLPPDWKWHS